MNIQSGKAGILFWAIDAYKKQIYGIDSQIYLITP